MLYMLLAAAAIIVFVMVHLFRTSESGRHDEPIEEPVIRLNSQPAHLHSTSNYRQETTRRFESPGLIVTDDETEEFNVPVAWDDESPDCQADTSNCQCDTSNCQCDTSESCSDRDE